MMPATRRIISMIGTVLVLLAQLHFSSLSYYSEFSIHSTNNNASTSQTAGPFYSDEEKIVMELIENYKRHHSLQALQNSDWTSEGLFVTGTYSCPYQSGNRLHHFLSAVVFSIVTNRTLLWNYCGEEEGYCPLAGTVESCESVLPRASWIPGYKTDFLSHYSGPASTGAPVAINHKHMRVNDLIQHKVVDFGIIENNQLKFLATDEASKLLDDASSSNAKKLFGAGRFFAYGALLHACFHIQVLTPPPTAADLSFAIHSRHQNNADLGNDVNQEMVCLNNAMKELNIDKEHFQQGKKSCTLSLMADRKETPVALREKANQTGCEVLQASRRAGQSWMAEHGPFAGAGFFDDLSFAQYAVDGVFTTKQSTASELLLALVAFQRARVLNRRPLLICEMCRTTWKLNCIDSTCRCSRDEDAF